MRSLAIAFAAGMLALPQVAAAADLPCLTSGEVAAATAYALPGALSATADKCAPTLGKASYFARNGAQLAQRFAATKARAWPATRAAILRVASVSKDPMLQSAKNLPDGAMQDIVNGLVTAAVADKIPVGRCGQIDRVLELISPLPPENATELVALTLGVLAQGPNPHIGKLAICKA